MSTNLAVNLEASLECELDGQPVSVNAENGLIVVKIHSSKDARSMLRLIRGLGDLRANAARINEVLLGTSQQLQVQISDATIVSMGRDTESGLMRLAGFPNVKVWPLRFLKKG